MGAVGVAPRYIEYATAVVELCEVLAVQERVTLYGFPVAGLFPAGTVTLTEFDTTL
jgi:hypothetical protein